MYGFLWIDLFAYWSSPNQEAPLLEPRVPFLEVIDVLLVIEPLGAVAPVVVLAAFLESSLAPHGIPLSW